MLALTFIVMSFCKFTEAGPWQGRRLDIERRSPALSDEVIKMLHGLEETAKNETESTITKVQ